MEKTAAESVEDIIAPISSPSKIGNENMRCIVIPITSVERATPSVERPSAPPIAFLMHCHFVSIPPEKSMNTRATTPISCDNLKSSKYICPGPSVPASIPIARKINRAGIPRLLDNFVITTLTRISTDIKSNIYSNIIKVASFKLFYYSENLKSKDNYKILKKAK